MTEMESTEIKLSGISVSPGICIGKAYLVDNGGVDVVERYLIEPSEIKNEVKRFKSAVKRAKDELRAIIDNTPEDFRRQSRILETQEVLLKDKMLYGRTIETIEKESINAEWALKSVVTGIKSIFQNMTDPYLKDREADVVHLSGRIMRNLMGADQVNISKIDKRVILVAPDLSPADTSQINLERIKGFVTEKGGKASHTGIIARTLQIPAVLGLENATSLIHNDDIIIIDGKSGHVIINPADETLIEYEERKEDYDKRKAIINRKGRLPAETIDGFSIGVLGNMELPGEVVSVHSAGGEGVGLYRTEFEFMNRERFPSEEELFDSYSDVVSVMAPMPVTIRTLDINGDKALGPGFATDEINPALGLRGIRYCLRRPDVFKTQLRAILRASTFGKVKIMFPMVSTYTEVIESKKILTEVADSLEKENVSFDRDVKIGVLIEVPSAVIMADLLASEVDFFSVGTNDLIQYSFAIDRGNKDVLYLFQPLDPAVLRMLKHLAEVAKGRGINISVCGEMASYPIHVPILLGIGMDELSMNPQSIPAVKNMIRSIKMDDTRRFMQTALKQTSATNVYKLLLETYGHLLPDKFDIINNDE
ncbi:MAG: phosphoenolpyruvate--protein phosphotransferase [Deltaproteobacteria bacterium]|nr:MAG: phosphoenolpyruvate--protein phosphotransferase [Deltaproteobacteria bacterium]